MDERSAYFAGGCFWCITPPLRSMDGVCRVRSGYCGGNEENPSYEDVKSQKTAHRETVRIDYHPNQVSFPMLLSTFLHSVDPFDGGGQFIDRGRSYTLAIYYSNQSEKAFAEQAILELEEESGRKTAVSIEPFRAFWEAEEYHQDYDLKHPEAFQKELRDSGRITE